MEVTFSKKKLEIQQFTNNLQTFQNSDIDSS